MMGRGMVALAAIFLSGGCTIIRIDGADPKTRIVPGIVRVQPKTPESMLLVRSTGLGIVMQSHGTTLGYVAETAAYVQDARRCAIILFEPKANDLDRLARLLAADGLDGDNVCIGGEIH